MSHHAVLGVGASATQEDIRSAFKRRALEVHPDKGGTAEEFQEVIAAFEALLSITDENRKLHDSTNSKKRSRGEASGGGKPHKRCQARSSSPTVASATKKQKRSGWSGHTKGTLLIQRRPTEQSQMVNTVQGMATAIETHKTVGTTAIEIRKTVGGGSSKGGCLHRLCKLLQQLSPERRRRVLLEELSEAQRLQLEQWMLAGGRLMLKKRAQKSRRVLLLAKCKQQQKHWQQQKALQRQWQQQRTGVSGAAAATAETAAKPVAAVSVIPKVTTQTTSNSGKNDSGGPTMSVHFGRGGEGRSRVRGIASEVRHGQLWYGAIVTLDMIQLVTRKVRELAVAINYLVALTDIKGRIVQATLEGARQEANSAASSASNLRGLLDAALFDHALDAEKDLGLRFVIRVPAKRWIGTNLWTPWFRASDLEQGIRAWRLLSHARGRSRCGRHNFNTYSPEQLQSTWLRVRSAYLDFLSEMGHSHVDLQLRIQGIPAKLDAFEKAFLPRQQREVERWNRGAMAREERRQRSLMYAEQQQLRRERRQMVGEDASSKRAASWDKRLKMCVESEKRIEHRIILCIRRWVHQISSAEKRRKRAEHSSKLSKQSSKQTSKHFIS